MSGMRASLLAVVALMGLASMAAGQTAYSVTDLGVLRGGSARVHGINFGGQVVGGSGFVYGADRHAFLWNHGSGMRDLGRLAGGDISEAYAINDAGLIAGTSNTATSMNAFTWSSGGGLQRLPLLPGANASQAYAVNSQGQVAGASGTHAVLWSNGQAIDLGTLGGGDWSEAHGLNNAGDVVGYSSSPESMHAFYWSNGQMSDLGVLAGDESSRANFINDQRMAVGASYGGSGVHAFLWTPADGMQPLGSMGGNGYSEAFGLNNLGQVVGAADSPMGTRAFLWDAADGMVDLNTRIGSAPATLVLTGAFAINDKGQIVAFGINEPNLGRSQEADSDRNMHHAGTRVFLLTPQ